MENFISLCQKRRSIRKYSAEPVSPQDIEKIVQCALMSPSAKRINPWECIVVTDKTKLEALAKAKKFGSNMFVTAPLAFVIVVDPTLTDMWQFDGAIMAHNITLCATDLGLGACWCQIYGREHDFEDPIIPASQYIKKMLSIPDQKEVVCIVSVGHSDEQRKEYDLSKLPYEKIHKEKY